MKVTKEELIQQLISVDTLAHPSCRGGAVPCDECAMHILCTTDPEFRSYWQTILPVLLAQGPSVTFGGLFALAITIGAKLAEVKMLEEMVGK